MQLLQFGVHYNLPWFMACEERGARENNLHVHMICIIFMPKTKATILDIYEVNSSGGCTMTTRTRARAFTFVPVMGTSYGLLSSSEGSLFYPCLGICRSAEAVLFTGLTARAGRRIDCPSLCSRTATSCPCLNVCDSTVGVATPCSPSAALAQLSNDKASPKFCTAS